MTKLVTPDDLKKLYNSNNDDKIRRINEKLKQAALDNKRECYIYDNNLYNSEIINMLKKQGFNCTCIPQDYIGGVALKIFW